MINTTLYYHLFRFIPGTKTVQPVAIASATFDDTSDNFALQLRQRITTHNCGSSFFPRIASRAHSRLLMHMCTNSLALAFIHYGFTVVHTCCVISIMRPSRQQNGKKTGLTVSAKSVRTEKIFFFKKTLFLKSKYYPARNKSLNWCRIDIDTMISTPIRRRSDVV